MSSCLVACFLLPGVCDSSRVATRGFIIIQSQRSDGNMPQQRSLAAYRLLLLQRGCSNQQHICAVLCVLSRVCVLLSFLRVGCLIFVCVLTCDIGQSPSVHVCVLVCVCDREQETPPECHIRQRIAGVEHECDADDIT